MLKKVDYSQLGRGESEWLDSYFHFSFGEYYDKNRMGFGDLRVINDDLIQPNSGFALHPHQNMEIITYVVSGELTHEDSMNNQNVLRPGEVQYMSAGTGVTHSEHNFGQDTLRLLQIWILPDKLGYAPRYGDYRYEWDDRKNNWLQIVSGEYGTARVKIHQDMNIYVSWLEEGKQLIFDVVKNRQAYLLVIEGECAVNHVTAHAREAVEITGETIGIQAKKTSHVILFDMRQK